MGELERRTSFRRKRIKIQDGLALALYSTTAIALSILAPNVVQLLQGIDPDLARNRHPTRRMNQAVTRLVERGLVAREGTPGNRRIALTKKGKSYAARLQTLAPRAIPKQRWDGRWRIVIFDIWERRRSARNQLRTMLQKIGFRQIQKSVWAYPYDCEDLIAFIRTDLRLGKSALYFIAEGVEYDDALRRDFGLPPLRKS